MPFLSAMRFAAAASCVLGIGGCSTAAKVDVGQVELDYQSSVADYRKCLAAFPNNPKACEGRRFSWKPTNAAFNNITGKWSAIRQQSANLRSNKLAVAGPTGPQADGAQPTWQMSPLCSPGQLAVLSPIRIGAG
jgi:hypothetical protein